jgi:hypothetical protein
LLRPSRGGQEATAKHGNDAEYAPHRQGSETSWDCLHKNSSISLQL